MIVEVIKGGRCLRFPGYPEHVAVAVSGVSGYKEQGGAFDFLPFSVKFYGAGLQVEMGAFVSNVGVSGHHPPDFGNPPVIVAAEAIFADRVQT